MSLSWETMPGDAVANRLLQLGADFVRLISNKDGAAQRLTDLAAATAAAEQKIGEARAAPVCRLIRRNSSMTLPRIRASTRFRTRSVIRA